MTHFAACDCRALIRAAATPFPCLLISRAFYCAGDCSSTSTSIKMPSRNSARTPTTTRAAHKPSTQTLASRKFSTSPVVVPGEGPTSILRAQICSIFSDAQKSAAGHRKLIVGLRKIQEACCYGPPRPSKPGRQEYDEDDFNVEIARCAVRLVGVKKSEAVGDRVVRFLGGFLRHASEKG